jgi:hypothetical protein
LGLPANGRAGFGFHDAVNDRNVAGGTGLNAVFQHPQDDIALLKTAPVPQDARCTAGSPGLVAEVVAVDIDRAVVLSQLAQVSKVVRGEARAVDAKVTVHELPGADLARLLVRHEFPHINPASSTYSMSLGSLSDAHAPEGALLRELHSVHDVPTVDLGLRARYALAS